MLKKLFTFLAAALMSVGLWAQAVGDTFEDETSGSQYATLYIPFGTKTVYEAADVWKDFGTMPEPGYQVVFGEYIMVEPEIESGDTVAVGTEVIFTAANREGDGFEFGGFFKDPEFKDTITVMYIVQKGDTCPVRRAIPINPYVYGTTITDAPVSVYAKYVQATALPETNATDRKNIKIVRDGQLLIRKEDKTYNAMGAEVR